MLPSWMKSKGTFGLSVVAALIVAGYVLFERVKKRRRQAGSQTAGDAQGQHNPGIQPAACPDYIYDGIILSCDVELQTSKERRGVIDLMKYLKGNSNVPHLSLALYQELPLGNRTAFDCMGYVLEHCRYIFVYVSKNLTEDNITKFNIQMCLHDVIQNNSWRVIPIFAEKDGRSECPGELQLLHGLEMWHLSSTDTDLHKLFTDKFNKTIIDGRNRLAQECNKIC